MHSGSAKTGNKTLLRPSQYLLTQLLCDKNNQQVTFVYLCVIWGLQMTRGLLKVISVS